MKQKVMNFVFENHKKIVLTCSFIVVFVLACLTMTGSFAILKPVKTVSISSEQSSYVKKDPGSWNIEKSAEWIGKGKARITFDLDTIVKKNNNYTDVIFVLDSSGSMIDAKLAKVKSDAKDLVENLFSTTGNRAAVITFDYDSTILSYLTDDKTELIKQIDSLSAYGTTNYYQALVNVDKVLKNYTKEQDREMIVLFLTDGYPNEDTPNEAGFYTYLKNQYPYIIVNGIQYEMGDTVLEPIKNISDNQYIAHMDDLRNVLFEAADTPLSYSEFTITDYIDDGYFTIDSVDDINVSLGEKALEYEGTTPKITWTMNEGILKSGSKAQMTIDVTLKDEYLGSEELYPTNKKEEFISKLTDNPNEDFESPKTPVLSESYEVQYESNAPDGCTITNAPSNEKHTVHDTVKISEDKLKCENYQFKGWEIITEDVKKMNDDYFVMPENNVILRGVWSSLNITKSMSGEVSKVQTLYKIMADNAVSDGSKSEHVYNQSGINFDNCPSISNGQGIYELSSTSDHKHPIYYYRGNIDNNNVSYAGFCWKAIRTTDTGGVKLLYNGQVDSNGKCVNVGSPNIGTSQFNKDNHSLSDVGYMYGDIYSNQVLGDYNIYLFVSEINLNDYYGTDVDIINIEGESLYTLKNQYQISSIGEASSVVGKYLSVQATDATHFVDRVLYVVGVQNNLLFSIVVGDGYKYPDYYMMVGDGITKNSNGTLNLTNPAKVTPDAYYKNYLSYVNKYTCGNTTSTCASPYLITSADAQGYDYLPVGDFVYGSSFTYNNGTYTLNNTVQFYDWNSNKDQVNNHHYTCLNSNGVCNELYYIYFSDKDEQTNVEGIYYIKLNNGVSADNALTNMKKNTNDSEIKKVVDTWYERNILNTPYKNILEDTVYCNDREMNKAGSEAYINNGWIPNGGNIRYPMLFKNYGYLYLGQKPTLECSNKNDAFTVDVKNGNGALKYPVSLLTFEESKLVGGCDNYINSDDSYWLLSPLQLNNQNAYGISLAKETIILTPTAYPTGVRPVVSIRPGVRIGGGTGLASDPYQLELD